MNNISEFSHLGLVIESGINVKQFQNCLSKLNTQYGIDFTKLTLCHEILNYSETQKYGSDLELIKYIDSLSQDTINFHEKGISKMYEYLLSHSGVVIFIGDTEGVDLSSKYELAESLNLCTSILSLE